MFISFIRVIFGTPNIVTKISVAIVISSLPWLRLLTRVITWHLNEVRRSIAMASNVAYVYFWCFVGYEKRVEEVEFIEVDCSIDINLKIEKLWALTFENILIER